MVHQTYMWIFFPIPGGKKFSRNLQPLDADGNAISMWAKDGEGQESSEEEESESEEGSEDEDAAASAAKEEASRADRKAQKKARKDAAIAKAKGKTVEVGDLPSSEDEEEESEDDDMPANPNHSRAARNQAKAPREDVEEITEGVSKMAAAAPQSRREREAVEAAAAKERYMRLQAQGKTDEAKADLARLKLIREQRAAEAERRQVITSPPDPSLCDVFFLRTNHDAPGREGGKGGAGQGSQTGDRGEGGQAPRQRPGNTREEGKEEISPSKGVRRLLHHHTLTIRDWPHIRAWLM